MTGREWVLDIGERRPLTLNGQRRNPYVHAREVKALRRIACLRALEAKIPPLGRVQVELHYAPRDRRRRDPAQPRGFAEAVRGRDRRRRGRA